MYAVFYNTAMGALLETTRKRGFFVRTSELVCRFLQYGLGRTFRNHAKAWFFVRISELVCRFLQYGLGRAFKQKPVLKKSGYFFAKFPSSKICLLILDLLD